LQNIIDKIEDMRNDGEPIPEPTTRAAMVAVAS
jgi:hypothetical protein